VKEACRDGCPKHRFTITPDGEPGLHALCGADDRHVLPPHPQVLARDDAVARGRTSRAAGDGRGEGPL